MDETAARSEIDRIIASDPNGELDRDELLAWSSPQLLLSAIYEQAESLGIEESHLVWIAAKSLLAALPEGWVQYKDSEGRLYYHNHDSGKSRWDHPMDEQYRDLYQTYTLQSAVHPTTHHQPDALAQLDRALMSASREWKMQVVGILEAHGIFTDKDLDHSSARLAKCELALDAATRKLDEAEAARRALTGKLDQALAAGERLEAECDDKTRDIADLRARHESTLHDRDRLRLALGEASERHRRDRLEFERVAEADRSQWAEDRQVLERELIRIKEQAETVAIENARLERRAKDDSELKHRLDRSKESLREAKDIARDLEVDRVKLNGDVAALREHVDLLRKQLQVTKVYSGKLETARAKLDCDDTVYRKEVKGAHDFVDDTTVCLQRQEGESIKLHCDNAVLRKSLGDARERLEEVEDSSRKLETERVKLDRDNRALRKQLEESQHLYDDTAKSVRYQESERAKLNHDNSVLRSSLAEMRLQLQDIEGHSHKLQSERAKLDRDNDALREQIEEAQEVINDTTEDLKRERESRAQVNRDNVILREQLDGVRQQLREAEENSKRRVIRCASLERENDMLQLQLREAENVITESSRHREDDRVRLDRDNVSLNEQLNDMRNKFNAFVEKSQSELDESGRQHACKVAELREECEKLDRNNASFKLQMTDIRHEFNEFVEKSQAEVEESGRQHACKVAEVREECQVMRHSALESREELVSGSKAVKRAEASARAFDEELRLLREAFRTNREYLKRVEIELSAAHSALSKRATSIAAAESLEADDGDLSMLHVKDATACMADVDEWRVRYREERGKRRELHNKLMELQGNIRVACRCRPSLPRESAEPDSACCVEFPIDGAISVKNDTGITQRYEFDHVFQPGSTQAEVYQVVEPYVQSVLDGHSICIFAYGQTGSGKSHTMLGSVHDRGVYYRAIMQILQHDTVSSCTLSVLEIYNETIQDLLAARSASSKLEVKGGGVPGLTEHPVESIDDVERYMTKGNSARTVGSHEMNEHSSRSHLIIVLNLRTCGVAKPLCSRLNLIDLAGSERLSRTKAVGSVAKEAAHINRSLSALGDVIHALGKPKPQHVPYRNSKLTHFLQESLSRSAKMLMLVNISPAQANASETICSLAFAARCREIKLSFAAAVTNASQASASANCNDDLLKARKVIRALQAKVAAAQSLCPNCARLLHP